MKNIVFTMISLMILSFSSLAWHIEIFTTSAYPVALNGGRASLCELDVLTNITRTLNQHGTLTPALKEEFKRHNTLLISFYQCQEQARSYALKSLPAIVFDKSFVVYGVHSLERALLLMQRHQEVLHG